MPSNPTIPLTHLQQYSICPHKFSLDREYKVCTSPEAQYRTIVKEVIKQSYINVTKHGYLPRWETVKSRVNKLAYQNVDIADQIAFDEAYQRSIKALSIIRWWYYRHFVDDTRFGLPNVPLQEPINNSILTVNVDLILFDNEHQTIVPVIFDYDGLESNQLYNSIYFKTLMWLINKQLGNGKLITKAEYWTITNSTLQIKNVYSRTKLDKIERSIQYLVRGIEYEVFHPVVNETNCRNCLWKSRCVF